MFSDITLARALHVLAVVHWIGGVSLVTAVILPAVRRDIEPARRLALFGSLEHRFSRQARVSVTLAGITGFYMTARLHAWPRLAEPGQYWWMHAMIAVWLVFTIALFVAEPRFLQAWFKRRAAADPVAAFALVHRAHWGALLASLLTVGAAVLGAHGMFY